MTRSRIIPEPSARRRIAALLAAAARATLPSLFFVTFWLIGCSGSGERKSTATPLPDMKPAGDVASCLQLNQDGGYVSDPNWGESKEAVQMTCQAHAAEAGDAGGASAGECDAAYLSRNSALCVAYTEGRHRVAGLAAGLSFSLQLGRPVWYVVEETADTPPAGTGLTIDAITGSVLDRWNWQSK